MSRGLLWAVLASFFFSLMNVCAKQLSTSFPVAQVVFFRGFLGVALTLALMAWKKEKLEVARPGMLVTRGLLGGGSLLAMFFTIAHLKLGDASFLAHLSPIFVIVLATWLLREKLPASFYPAFTCAVVGAFLVLDPGMSLARSGYALVGIVGALLAAGASLSIRSLAADHSTEVIMLAFMSAALVMGLPWSHTFLMPAGADLPWILGIGTVSFAGQWFLTKAYSLEQASLVASVRYLGIFWALAWGYLGWGEVLGWSHLLGGVLILVGCLGLRSGPARPKAA